MKPTAERLTELHALLPEVWRGPSWSALSFLVGNLCSCVGPSMTLECLGALVAFVSELDGSEDGEVLREELTGAIRRASGEDSP